MIAHISIFFRFFRSSLFSLPLFFFVFLENFFRYLGVGNRVKGGGGMQGVTQQLGARQHTDEKE